MVISSSLTILTPLVVNLLIKVFNVVWQDGLRPQAATMIFLLCYYQEKNTMWIQYGVPTM
jgi:hypothetical protein